MDTPPRGLVPLPFKGKISFLRVIGFSGSVLPEKQNPLTSAKKGLNYEMQIQVLRKKKYIYMYLLRNRKEIKMYRAALGKILHQSQHDTNVPIAETCNKRKKTIFSSRTDHLHQSPPACASHTLH